MLHLCMLYQLLHMFFIAPLAGKIRVIIIASIILLQDRLKGCFLPVLHTHTEVFLPQTLFTDVLSFSILCTAGSMLHSQFFSPRPPCCFIYYLWWWLGLGSRLPMGGFEFVTSRRTYSERMQCIFLYITLASFLINFDVNALQKVYSSWYQYQGRGSKKVKTWQKWIQTWLTTPRIQNFYVAFFC